MDESAKTEGKDVKATQLWSAYKRLVGVKNRLGTLHKEIQGDDSPEKAEVEKISAGLSLAQVLDQFPAAIHADCDTMEDLINNIKMLLF